MNLVLKNTLTNYVSFGLKILSSFYLTKVLFDMLGEDGYGFWSMLWSVYGYTLLLDFGFGWAIQKKSAEYVVDNNVVNLSKAISSAVALYAIISLLLILFSIFAVPWINTFGDSLFVLTDEMKVSYLLFSVGSSIVFQTGLYSEILVGLKKIYIRNYIRIVTYIINFLGVLFLSKYGYGLKELTFFTVVNHLVPNIVLFILVKLNIPKLKISISNIDFETFKETTRFSVYAYLITFSNLMLMNTDTLIISSKIGFVAAGIYQIGIKLSILLKQLNEQFQENIFPSVVANKNLKGNYLTLNVNKLLCFSLGIGFSFSFIYADELLYSWLGLIDPEAVLISRLSIIYVSLSLAIKSTNNLFLVGYGYEKPVAFAMMSEVVINIVLTIVFIKYLGSAGAILASLLALLINSIIAYFPMLKKYSDISFKEWFRNTIAPILLPIALCLNTFYIIKYYFSTSLNLMTLFILGLVSTLIYIHFFLLKLWDVSEIKRTLGESKLIKVLLLVAERSK